MPVSRGEERRGHFCSRRRETVNAALAEYVQRRKQQRLLGLFGAIDFDPTYSYKREPAAKRR
jgi:hypothetical protein